ncbi:class I SAM-dependent methyltransferase [Desertibacillus haloalkaliphilus]|uniref:class I SAM-dependent methyltransferase n=1 Tax=Desertibacillus haloalkaliphilus TaxID=1328930 RepID=UPI001C273858|nr:class I SAM-dependent methyltransferase [Desertibacillus haloalkaliphilus]MBU8905280.1 methyltransferase domain-containing protein [Desertibacillus haloalkaliphilus]
MKLHGILPFARFLLEAALEKGGIAIDCTIGNGNDTLYLANLVGSEGHVYGFDIQGQALINTKERLQEHGVLERTTLFEASHDQIDTLIPKETRINAAIFNLGYLPGGNKEIVTEPTSTIAALEQLLARLEPGGIIVLVVYHGHEQGKVERDAVTEFVTAIDQKSCHVLRYEFVNQTNNPPFILALEKR